MPKVYLSRRMEIVKLWKLIFEPPISIVKVMDGSSNSKKICFTRHFLKSNYLADDEETILHYENNCCHRIPLESIEIAKKINHHKLSNIGTVLSTETRSNKKSI